MVVFDFGRLLVAIHVRWIGTAALNPLDPSIIQSLMDGDPFSRVWVQHPEDKTFERFLRNEVKSLPTRGHA